MASASLTSPGKLRQSGSQRRKRTGQFQQASEYLLRDYISIGKTYLTSFGPAASVRYRTQEIKSEIVSCLCVPRFRSYRPRSSIRSGLLCFSGVNLQKECIKEKREEVILHKVATT